MDGTLQPQVADSQQLQRAWQPGTMQPMVANTPDEYAQGFAKRFAKTLDLVGIPDDRHRRSWVAKTFDVSTESARKWLTGESVPQPHRIVQIAKHLLVHPAWLQFGEVRGPTVAEAQPGYGEMNLSARERALVMNFRAADDTTKRIIETVAATATEQP